MRTTVPTLASFLPISRLAARRGWDIVAWLYQDRAVGPLEASAGRWRAAIQPLAFPARLNGVPSVADSAAAFNLHVRPLERAEKTRFKYQTHRLSVLTWAVWKDVLPLLLPMSDDFLRAYIWDCLAFGASLPVLKHAIDAIKAWHSRLGMRCPASGHGDYRRLTTSLSRFQGQPQRIKFPIHRRRVGRASSPAASCPGASPLRGRQAPLRSWGKISLPGLLDLSASLVRLPGWSHSHHDLRPVQGGRHAPGLLRMAPLR